MINPSNFGVPRVLFFQTNLTLRWRITLDYFAKTTVVLYVFAIKWVVSKYVPL